MRPITMRRSILPLVLFALTMPAIVTAASDPADLAYRVHVGTTDAELLAWSVAGIGDVNGDGVKDYVLGVPGSGTYFQGRARVMSGLTGEMLHSFGGLSIVDFSGWSVADAGDVDNDGFDDVIMGLPFSGTAAQGAAWINSGATGALIREIHGNESNALTGWSVAGAGDVNGDGYADVVVGTPYAGRADVFSGADGSILLTWSGPKLGYCVAGVGDVNGDGHPDLALGAPDGGLVDIVDAYHQTLIRTITGSTTNKFGQAVANAGDTDGDGVNDIIIGSDAGAYLYSGSTGQKRYSFVQGLGAAVAGAGDVNADGYDDVIIGDSWTTSAHTGRVEVRSGLTGALLRFFDGGPSVTEFGSCAAGIGDVNGDGFTDLLVGAPRAGLLDEGAAYIFLGGPNFSDFVDFGEYHIVNAHPTFALTADLDRRHFADIIALDPATDQLSVHQNIGEGHFFEPSLYATGSNPTSVAAADLDHDGDLDLIVACSGDDRIMFFRNVHGILHREGTRTTGVHPSSVVAADFNRDGFADLAVTNRDDGTVYVFIHNRHITGFLNTFLRPPVVYSIGSDPVQILAGDFNGDHLVDLAVADAQSHKLAIRRGRGDGTFRGTRFTSLPAEPRAMYTGDFDRDGKIDLAWLARDSNQVMISTGLGTGYFAGPLAFPVSDSPLTAITGIDADRDGFLDLALTSANDAYAVVLLNDHLGGFGDSIVVATGAGPTALAAADFDGDSDPDLVTTNRDGGSLSVLKNRWFDSGP